MARTQIVENLQIALGASIDKAMGQTLAQWERQNMSAAGKAAASFKGFDAAVGKAHNSLLSFRNLAVVGIVAGLGAMVGRMLNSADAIQDAAEAAGLSTTRFQELRFAFQFAGVSAESFGSSMSRFAKTVGEAAQGNDDLIETFKRIGVSIYDVNGNLRDQDGILNDTIAGVSKIGTQAERAATAYQFFGREAGAKLAGAIGQGTDAIDAFVQKAHDMNLILSEDAIKNAARAADELDTLSAVIGIRLTAAIARAAPAIQTLVNGLAWLLEPFDPPGNDLNRIEGVAAALDDIAAKQAAIASGSDAGAARSSPEQRQIASDMLSRQRAALEARLAKLQRDAEFPGSVVSDVGDPSAMSGSAARKKAEAEAEKWAEKLRDLREIGLDHTKSVMDAEEAEELKHLTRRMEALTGFEKQKADAQAAYRDATDEMRADAIEKDLDAADKTADAWGNALRETAHNFDILFDKSLSGWERVGKFALETLTRIAEAAATQAGGGQDPYKQAGGWLAGALGGLGGLGGLFGGGAPSATASAGGVSASGLIGWSPMAHGGPVSGGSPYLVGERGPELFLPKSAGDIIPNHKISGGSGGTSVNQTIVFHLSPGVPETVRREVAAMIPAITRATKAGVSDDARRNRQAS